MIPMYYWFEASVGVEKQGGRDREEKCNSRVEWNKEEKRGHGERPGPEVVSSGSPVGLTCWTTSWPEVHCTATDTVAVPLLSVTPSSFLDAQCAEENNKGFFLRTDNLSPRCLPDYATVIFFIGCDFTPTDDSGFVPTLIQNLRDSVFLLCYF